MPTYYANLHTRPQECRTTRHNPEGGIRGIAAGALALVRDGQLALDEPLPDRPYTLRQLLQHRAGVADYGKLSAYHDADGHGRRFQHGR